jgi:hypothetical protein
MVNLADARWLCCCDCGTERYVSVVSLTYAQSLSCGCFTVDRTRYTARLRRLAREAERIEQSQVDAYNSVDQDGETR